MIWLLLLAAGGAYLWVSRPPEASFTWKRDLEAALAEAGASGRLILLEFQTAGCPACDWMDRNVFNRPDVGTALEAWLPVRVDGNLHPRVASRYDIEAFPTFLVLDPQGRELARSVGAAPAGEFLLFLQRTSARRLATSPSAL